MGGWKYEWVGELPIDVYDVLVDMLKKEAQQPDDPDDPALDDPDTEDTDPEDDL
jgi:hypothetical protein